ncbi:hypothetical protein EV699_114139 [Plasticicumulans lactativorans]|uniref:Uncharacterized protein n=1 Tax=Plasticicumulans lactativorans TaxID=1133106 RepID=A0A4R2L2D8_9GAMM|nr:hypothetical protein [Plasticicumulans lactativorans]TCO80493.1 hypothetical protein EV699_114139 [Plasticicumulans lactativorans]
MSNDATGSGRRAAAAAEYRPLRDLTPDEVDAHMFELYEEHAVRKEQRQRGEPVPDAGPVHLVARFIESEACKVLDANGYRPLRDLAGLSQEDVRLQWMNEVFQQGKAIGTDAIPWECQKPIWPISK